VALDSAAGEAVTVAKAVIITTGGLTRIFRRNSASANMGGDGYALALEAGADLGSGAAPAATRYLPRAVTRNSQCRSRMARRCSTR
jgi:hypothetical protein